MKLEVWYYQRNSTPKTKLAENALTMQAIQDVDDFVPYLSVTPSYVMMT